MSFSESELEDIAKFNQLLTTACTDDCHFLFMNLNFARRCSDGKRRTDIQDYLDFLFTPSVEEYISSKTSQYTDRVIKLNDSVTTHLEFVITLKT